MFDSNVHPSPQWRTWWQRAESKYSELQAWKKTKLDENIEYWKSKGALTPQDEADLDWIDDRMTKLWTWISVQTEQDYDNVLDQVEQIQRAIEDIRRRHGADGGHRRFGPGGSLLPNGTRIGGGGTHTGPGGIGGPGMGDGVPSLPGQFGGRFGGLGNRSGRGPGGSQYLPGLGFFPGAGPGAGGGVGHGIGGFGPGMGDSDGPPGPWGTAGGLGSFKKGHSGTGRQPGGGTAGRRGSGGYSETSKDRSDRGGGGGDVDRDKPTTGGGGGGGTIDKAGERAPAGGLSWGSLLHDDDKSGGTPKMLSPAVIHPLPAQARTSSRPSNQETRSWTPPTPTMRVLRIPNRAAIPTVTAAPRKARA